MRDIRSDLQERADLIEEQVRAAYAHFEKAVQRLQHERDARIAELQGAHAVINKLIELEAQFMGNVVPLDSSAPRLSQAEKMAASG